MTFDHEPHDPISGCDCRECAIWERDKLREIVGALRYPFHADDRAAAQAEGKHPRPCAKFCEANAFEADIRMLRARVREQQQELERLRELERRVAKRCSYAVPQWAPELRELIGADETVE